MRKDKKIKNTAYLVLKTNNRALFVMRRCKL